MASETDEYEIKCEIRCCSICGDWIEYSKTRTIIKRKHYHKNCILDLYLKLQMLNASSS